MRTSAAALLIVGLSALPAAAGGQQSEENKAYIRLSRIKQVTLVSSHYLNGRVFMEIKFAKQYDRHGNLTMETGYDSDDGLPVFSTMTLYSYDEHNRLRGYTSAGGSRDVSHTLDGQRRIVETVVRNKSDGALFERYVFTRNPDGAVSDERVYRGSAVHRHRSYTYDQAGNLIDVREVGGDGSVIRRRTHAYNARGNVTESVEYGPKGISHRTEFVYQRDHLMEERDFDDRGVLSRRKVLTRDADGFPVETAEYDAAGVLQSVTRTTYEFYRSPERRLTP